MRTLVICFFAAEDGSPIDGSAQLLAGRWRTAVDAKQKPIHGGPEVRFEIGDDTVVNEVLATSPRRYQRFFPWPKSDVLNVRLEKAGELIIAANHDAARFVQVHATGGQEVNDHLRSLGKDFHLLRCGQSIHNMRLLPGPYAIDVFDDAKKPLTQLTVDVPAWRTMFVEVP
jgi:hypothetical protein